MAAKPPRFRDPPASPLARPRALDTASLGTAALGTAPRGSIEGQSQWHNGECRLHRCIHPAGQSVGDTTATPSRPSKYCHLTAILPRVWATSVSHAAAIRPVLGRVCSLATQRDLRHFLSRQTTFEGAAWLPRCYAPIPTSATIAPKDHYM